MNEEISHKLSEAKIIAWKMKDLINYSYFLCIKLQSSTTRPHKDLQGHLIQCSNFTNEETEAKKKVKKFA